MLNGVSPLSEPSASAATSCLLLPGTFPCCFGHRPKEKVDAVRSVTQRQLFRKTNFGYVGTVVNIALTLGEAI